MAGARGNGKEDAVTTDPYLADEATADAEDEAPERDQGSLAWIQKVFELHCTQRMDLALFWCLWRTQIVMS